MIRCLHCGAETSNGLALCELCRRSGVVSLEFIPVYFRNLSRWRPGRAGSRPVPGSRVLYDGAVRGPGTGDKISDTLDEAFTALTTWARKLTEDRPHLPRPLTLTDAVLSDDLDPGFAMELDDDHARAAACLCAAFEEHLTSLATLDWCGEFLRDLRGHEERLRGLTETSVPGWYAGACRRCKGQIHADQRRIQANKRADDDQQIDVVRHPHEEPTYVVPGLTWVTCQCCGATTSVGDHLEIVLDEARDWMARPKRIAEALVALVDTEPSVPRLHARIRQWAQREKLTPVRSRRREHVFDLEAEVFIVKDQEVGHARYRLGEVLDVLTTEGATRLNATPTTASSGTRAC